MSIIQSIASLVNVTKDRINIKALKSGSVVVNGEITSQTATQDQGVVGSLQSALKVGLNIAGIPLLTFSVSSTTTNATIVTPPTPSQTQTIIINDES